MAVLALGAGLVAVAVAWLAMPSSDGARAAAGPAEAGGLHDPNAAEPPSPTADFAAARTAEPSERAQVPEAAKVRWDPAVHIDRGEIRVVGTVRAPPGVDDVKVSVRVAEPPPSGRDLRGTHSARVGANGRYSVDVTSFFLLVDVAPTALVVETEQSKVPDVSVTVPVSIESIRVDEKRLRSERTVSFTVPDIDIEVDLTIESPGMVRGHVSCERDPGGAIYVTAVEMASDGTPASAGAHAIVHPAGGEFEIAVDPARRYSVVACAAGLRPASVEVGVVGPATRNVGELWLSRGASVSGRLARPGDVDRVTARFAGDASGVVASAGGTLVWHEGTFDFAQASASVDAQGEFEIAGLASTSYELAPVSSSAGHAPKGARARVAAPASGLVIELTAVAVKVELRRDGKPLAKARVDWSTAAERGGTRSGAGATDADGHMTFWLEPGATIDVRVGERELTLAAGAESDAAWRVLDL